MNKSGRVMANTAPQSPYPKLVKRLEALLGMLGSMFVLGLALATVADYNPDTRAGSKLLHNSILGLHILLGIGILGHALLVLVATKRLFREALLMARVGLIAVVAAFGFGIARVAIDSEWYTFGMGMGFIVAVLVYARLFGYAQSRLRP